MSDTLVRFTLDLEQQIHRSGRYDGKAKEGRSEITCWTSNLFGFSEGDRRRLFENTAVEVVCTTDQFLDWLLERVHRGYCNSIRELRIERVARPKGHVVLHASGA